MARKKKDTMEFRFYEIPQGEPALVLYGESWVRVYGHDEFHLHFHNLTEIGICRYGDGDMYLDNDVCRYQNGTLTVIPVRTFNSYTNVELDTTNIPIGELVNSTTTNTIVWKPTSNSFRFNVYSTDVFLDTYGAVMVNPLLDVQQYFTQLTNFYRLQLRGFTVVGDSLTINGITGTTSGQNVTFNNCALNASAPVDGKAAIEIDSSLIKGEYVVKINNTPDDGFAAGNKSGKALWNHKNGSKATIIVDGVTVE